MDGEGRRFWCRKLTVKACGRCLTFLPENARRRQAAVAFTGVLPKFTVEAGGRCPHHGPGAPRRGDAKRPLTWPWSRCKEKRSMFFCAKTRAKAVVFSGVLVPATHSRCFHIVSVRNARGEGKQPLRPLPSRWFRRLHRTAASPSSRRPQQQAAAAADPEATEPPGGRSSSPLQVGRAWCCGACWQLGCLCGPGAAGNLGTCASTGAGNSPARCCWQLGCLCQGWCFGLPADLLLPTCRLSGAAIAAARCYLGDLLLLTMCMSSCCARSCCPAPTLHILFDLPFTDNSLEEEIVCYSQETVSIPGLTGAMCMVKCRYLSLGLRRFQGMPNPPRP